MAPADSLAHLRKSVLDRVSRGAVTVAHACRDAGISRARYYQLRRRYLAYGEAGLRPKPHPARPTRQLPAPLVDAIVSYAIFHPTEGERSICCALALSRYGSWRVSHGGVRNVLRRAGLGRRLARLAAAEALSAAEGGPLTERTLREIRAIERPKIMHIGSAVVGAELFADTALFFDDNTRIVMRGVHTFFHTATGERSTELTSRFGTFNTRTGSMEARGDVVVHAKDGRVLTTEQLRYDQARNLITGDSAFSLTQPGGRKLEGTGFVSDPSMANVQVLKAARGTAGVVSDGGAGSADASKRPPAVPAAPPGGTFKLPTRRP